MSVRSSGRKRLSFKIADEEEEEEMDCSQADMFQSNSEEEEEAYAGEGEADDLLTQARTQIEGKYIGKKAKTNVNLSGIQNDDAGHDDGVVFNPKPNEKNLVKVRQAYGTLNNEINQNHAQLVEASGTTKVIEMVASANTFLREIQRTNEAILDSRFISSVAELSAEKIQKLPVAVSDFGINEFIKLARNTLRKLEPAELSQASGHLDDAWEQVGKRASIFWRGVTSCDFLCGPIGAAPKEKAERKQRVTKVIAEKAPLKVAQGMSTEDFQEQVALSSSSATPNNVMKVAQFLVQYDEPIPFHAFIANPSSFSRSVENLFYSSFLVSEGKAKILTDDDGEIYIVAAMPGDAAEETHVRPKHQHVFNFSMTQWREAIEKYQITEPVLDF